MRFARPALLALVLALALAPAANAHGDDEPNHRDTPAELAAANIGRTLAIAHLAGTTAPDLPEFLPTDVVRHGAAMRTTRPMRRFRPHSDRSRSCTRTRRT